MRLPTKKSAKRAERAETKKKNNNRNKQTEEAKKAGDKGLNKNFRCTEGLNVNNAEINLRKITYGMINTTNVTTFEIADKSKVDINDTWDKLIVILISYLYELKDGNKAKTIESLIINNVISNGCIVDTMDSEEISTEISKYKEGKGYIRYRVYNTGLYLGISLEASVIYRVTVGLIRACGIKYDKVTIGMELKNKIEEERESIWFSEKDEISTAEDNDNMERMRRIYENRLKKKGQDKND